MQLISRELYMNPNSTPTVDRPKPLFGASQLFQWDNKCSALDAEWECPAYAMAAAEPLRGTDLYLQYMEDRFQACRQAAGCNYTYTTSPPICTPGDPASRQQALQNAVELVCNDPSKEFPSQKSYDACVDRMERWVNGGCGNVTPGEVTNPVMNHTGWRQV